MEKEPFRFSPWPNQVKAAKRAKELAIMNEIEYFRLQVKLGWTNAEAALFFDVNVTTVRRWRNDKLPAPKAVIMCLKSIITGEPVGAK